MASLRHPAWCTLFAIFCSIVFIFQTERVAYHLYALRTANDLNEFLGRFSTCRLHFYDLHEYLSDDLIRRIDKGSYHGLRDVKLYVVTKGVGGGFPSSFRAYQFPFGPTLIFLRDHPKDTGAVQRFFILHELGHGTGKGTVIPAYAAVMRLIKISSFIWLVVSSEFRRDVILAAIVWLILGFIVELKAHSRFFNELVADRFAAYYLDDHDKSKLLTILQLRLLPKDLTLTEQENRVRLRMLTEVVTERDLLGENPTDIQRPYMHIPFALFIIASVYIGWILPAQTWTTSLRSSAGLIVFLFATAYLIKAAVAKKLRGAKNSLEVLSS